jgi:hypothetical protein
MPQIFTPSKLPPVERAAPREDHARAETPNAAPASRPAKKRIDSQENATDKCGEADTADDHHVLRLASDEDAFGDIRRVDADVDDPAHWKGSDQRPRRLFGPAELHALGVARRGEPLATCRVCAGQVGTVGSAVTIGLLPQFASNHDPWNRWPCRDALVQRNQAMRPNCNNGTGKGEQGACGQFEKLHCRVALRLKNESDPRAQ